MCIKLVKKAIIVYTKIRSIVTLWRRSFVPIVQESTGSSILQKSSYFLLYVVYFKIY